MTDNDVVPSGSQMTVTIQGPESLVDNVFYRGTTAGFAARLLARGLRVTSQSFGYVNSGFASNTLQDVVQLVTTGTIDTFAEARNRIATAWADEFGDAPITLAFAGIDATPTTINTASPFQSISDAFAKFMHDLGTTGTYVAVAVGVVLVIAVWHETR